MPEHTEASMRPRLERPQHLPDGAGVLIGAGLGSVIWLGLFAWIW